MSTGSGIEWTEATWNFVTGCNKVSPGCKFCYAEVMSKRLQAMGQKKYINNFKVTEHEEALLLPLTWKKSKIIFVNSMSDLFHKQISEEFILRGFHTMEKAHWHEYQILTKRSERLKELDSKINWQKNMWMGVSVENDKYQYRIDDLRETKAMIKFLSLEPLIGPLPKLNLERIDWVIVGGESGRKPRPINPNWVESIHKQCQEQRVPFFFKQWGGTNKKKAGRVFKGQTWDELPLNYLKRKKRKIMIGSCIICNKSFEMVRKNHLCCSKECNVKKNLKKKNK